MPTTRSADGTLIAFETLGQGPPLLLVDGALCHRGFGPMKEIAGLLKDHFTVYIYDRRGRGQSGDTAPWTLEREVEDVLALLDEAGGSAFVMGLSSGAALALEAARCGASISRLALFEAPFVVDDKYPPLDADYLPTLKALVAENKRGAAVKHFMRRVGVPRLMLGVMPLTPMWKKLKAVAPTLVYDISIVEPFQQAIPLPELLAPAGDWECAKAAVENGADAIYFGMEKFNARMRAHNFTEFGALPLLVHQHDMSLAK